MYDIQVADTQTLLQVDPDRVVDVLRAALQAQQVVRAEIAVAIMSDAEIHAVNRDHLQHDYPTDVISFLYAATPEPDSDSHFPHLHGAGQCLDGEILVSAETALRIAREVNWPPEAELTLYLVHGLLHLCGYDDLTPEEQAVMRDRERAILQIWQLTPHYST